MSSWLAGLRVRDLVDIAIVAFVLYRVLLIFRGTVAIQMLAGLGLLMAARFASRQADLRSLSFVLENFWAFWVLALIVLFQPELRRTLAQAGRSRVLQRVVGQGSAERRQVLAGGRAGRGRARREADRRPDRRRAAGGPARLRRAGRADGGGRVGRAARQPLPARARRSTTAPRSSRATASRRPAASCRSPATSGCPARSARATAPPSGLSEETDAVVVVVSEETGVISLAVDGVVERGARRRAARGSGWPRCSAPARLARGGRSLLAGVRRFTARSKA